MTILVLIAKELVHRWSGFALATLAVGASVALYVAFATTNTASFRETTQIMRDMGQNLRIIPKETDMDTFWSLGFSPATMPEEYVQRFTEYEGFTYTHLTAVLEKHIQWRGKTILLTGLLPEVMPPSMGAESSMTFSIKPGEAYVGGETVRALGLRAGETITIRSNQFAVVKCLVPVGSSDDIRVYANLHDVQEILGLANRISEIRALECLCIIENSGGKVDPLTLAQEDLAEMLPEAKVILLKGIAEIRQRQRALMSGYLALIMPLVFVACGAWICLLAVANVRERRREIGILRALGWGSMRIAWLVLGKAMLAGIAGTVLGYAAGTVLALQVGPGVFKIAARAVRPDYMLLVHALIAAPVCAMVASLVPAALAVTQDPAVTLAKEQ